MSYVVYNGVQMGLVRTKQLAQRPIMLGRNTSGVEIRAVWEVLISRHTFGAEGFAVDNNFVTARLTGQNAIDAYNQLSARLMLPRKKLTIRAGVEYVAALDSVDQQLGPTPLSFTIVGINGQGSVVAEFAIQYAVRHPCEEQDDPPATAILGHVWKVEDDLDDQFFMTRTYTGLIHLNPAVVGPFSGPAALHPDVYRGLLLPPRTREFHRDHVTVRQLEDGYTWAYRVVDKQPGAIVNHATIAKITAYHEVTNEIPSQIEVEKVNLQWFEFFTKWGDKVNDIIGRLGQAAKDPGGAVTGAIRDIWGGGKELLAMQSQYNLLDMSAVPTQTQLIGVEVFGKPQATFAEMARAARVVCLYRFMRGGYYGTDVGLTPILFGGAYKSRDVSQPRSHTATFTVRRRPPGMDKTTANLMDPRSADNAAVGVYQWALGRNEMPTIAGEAGPINPMVIRAPLGGGRFAEIPFSVRQLLFGGSILQPFAAGGFLANVTGFNWGWNDTAFAPDLMSGKDARIRADEILYNGQSSREFPSPLALALLAGDSNPCGYTTPAVLDTRVREALPQ